MNDVAAPTAASTSSSTMRDLAHGKHPGHARCKLEKGIHINLNGPFMLCKRVAKHMVSAGHQGQHHQPVLEVRYHLQYGRPAHYASAKGRST